MKELVCGGVAGATVDTILFPLDTIKTRLQSKQGFLSSGGYSKIYLGLSACLYGSIPSSATFFMTYSCLKKLLSGRSADSILPGSEHAVHLVAASLGEAAACITRVPAETVKQRLQANQSSSTVSTVKEVLAAEGIGGFYRAYFVTLAREIPFSCIQFPLYEYLRKLMLYHYAASQSPGSPPSWAIALCGLTAGGVAAALTTPLDVLKTRIILSRTAHKTDNKSPLNMRSAFLQIFHDCDGKFVATIRTLFSGIVPRIAWISIGGYFFFFSYESTHAILRW